MPNDKRSEKKSTRKENKANRKANKKYIRSVKTDARKKISGSRGLTKTVNKANRIGTRARNK